METILNEAFGGGGGGGGREKGLLGCSFEPAGRLGSPGGRICFQVHKHGSIEVPGLIWRPLGFPDRQGCYCFTISEVLGYCLINSLYHKLTR